MRLKRGFTKPQHFWKHTIITLDIADPGCVNTDHGCAVLTHLESILTHPLNTDHEYVSTDSGCVNTDPWMCQHRPLDVQNMFAGTDEARHIQVFWGNQTNQLSLGAWLYVVRSFEIS